MFLKAWFLLAIVLTLVAQSIFGQNRILHGRIITENLEPASFTMVLDAEGNKLAKTDLEDRFKIEFAQTARTFNFADVGCEERKISLNTGCDTLEIIMLYAGTYDFTTARKIDKDRLKRFNALKALHKIAYKKGLFAGKKFVIFRSSNR